MSSLTALDLTAATNAIARAVITAAMQAVADAFDVTLPAAVKRATPAPITKPGRPEDVPGRSAQIVAMHKNGVRARVIANHFSLTEKYVRQVVYRARKADPSIPRHRAGRPRKAVTP